MSLVLRKTAFSLSYENDDAAMNTSLYLKVLTLDHIMKEFWSFNAPNFEKVGRILLSASLCVRLSVQKKIKARVLKFHIWIPRQKIAYQYFFSCPNYLPLPSYVPFKV